MGGGPAGSGGQVIATVHVCMLLIIDVSADAVDKFGNLVALITQRLTAFQYCHKPPAVMNETVKSTTAVKSNLVLQSFQVYSAAA